jgi:hypothetical protein
MTSSHEPWLGQEYLQSYTVGGVCALPGEPGLPASQGLGLSDLATESLIDAIGYHLVLMYRVIGPTAGVVPGGHPEDAAGHLVQGDHDCKDQRLRMVADGSLAAQQLGQAGELVQ